jgi:hypothetical protein
MKYWQRSIWLVIASAWAGTAALLVMLPRAKSHRHLWALCSILPLQDANKFVVPCGAFWSARSYSSLLREVKLEVKAVAFAKHWRCSINTNIYVRHSHLHGHAPGVPQRKVLAVNVERMAIRVGFGRRGLEYSPAPWKKCFDRRQNDLYFLYKKLIMEGQT